MKFAVARIFDRVVQIGHAWARDTCSSKGQLEKNSSWKFWVRKSKVRNFSFKLESADRSWKVFNAVLSKKNFINLGSHFPTSFFLISFLNFELKNFKLLVFSNCLTCIPRAHRCALIDVHSMKCTLDLCSSRKYGSCL